MSVTAVPLRPIAKGSLAKLWLGIALLAGTGVALALTGTGKTVALHGTPEQFLAWNSRQAGVVTTASGLEYQVLTPGAGGAHPTAADVVLVNYEGRLRDGKVFDKGDHTPLELGKVIPGWTEGLALMPKGAKYRFWVPPRLGYGAEGAGGGVIPPNADLVFDIELIDFLPAAALRQQMQMQQMQGHGAVGAPDPAQPGQ